MKNPNLPYTNNGHLSQAQLLRYQEDAMDAAEMHRVEAHLLNCALCSDALEGLLQLAPDQQQLAVQELKERLTARTEQEKAAPAYWKWAVAASFVLLFSISLFLALNMQQGAEQPLAQQETTATETITGPKVKEPEERIYAPTAELSAEEAPLAEADHGEGAAASPVIATPQMPVLAELNEISIPEEVEVAPAPTQIIAEQTNEVTTPAEKKPISTASKNHEGQPGVPASVAPLELKSYSTEATVPPKSVTIRLRGSSSKSNSKVFSGMVVDATTGEPLPGVAVRIKGTPQGTVSDVNGNYSITLPDSVGMLQISYIGYKDQLFQVRPGSTPQLSELEPDVESLSEVVVTGAGVERTKKQLSYSSNTDELSIVAPKPVAGFKSFRKYVKEQQRYPAAALAAKVEGTVVVSFYVEEGGERTQFQVVASLGHGLDEEAIRLLQEGPKWLPATTDGKPVRQKTTAQIKFTLPRR